MYKSIFFLLLGFKMMLLTFRIKSLLMMLFAFEFLVLKMFFLYSFFNSFNDISSSLIFLAVVAGEASLGLSLLVLIVRSYGKDSNKMSKMGLCEGF